MQAMLAKRTVPTIMTIEGYMEDPHMEGAVAVLPSEMQLKVRAAGWLHRIPCCHVSG